MSETGIGRNCWRIGREKEIAKRYEKIIRHRIAAIQKKMWDPKKRFFYSLDRDSDRPINVRSIQGFLTLVL